MEGPTGLEAYHKAKELRAVGKHMLQEVWEDDLALKLHAVLDSMKVKWSSTDVVRILNTADSSSSVILWIGVMPGSLSGDDGVVVASKCLDILRRNNVADVEVEIRESTVTLLDGPRLLPFDLPSSTTVKVREPLTTSLGLPICAQSRPWAEGTGGFFITEDGKPERLLLVTARHVLFKADRNNNKHFEHKDDPYNVRLFGDSGFTLYLQSIEEEIGTRVHIADVMEKRLVAVQGRDDPAANRERQFVQFQLDDAREAQHDLRLFKQDVLTHWRPSESRVIGRTTLSPPINISFGNEGYTEDWAVIEIDSSKVNTSNFQGNIIDLSGRITSYDFTRMMNSNSQNAQNFTYPHDGLLRLNGTIPDTDMRKPTSVNQTDEQCLMVIKRGSGSGLTIGRANNIVSYKRYYYGDESDDEYQDTSKEWGIFSYDSKSGAFSDYGDSGSVIVDGLGRIGGLLTGGNGSQDSEASVDITYATPITFLLKRLQENGLHKPNVNPTLGGNHV